MKRIDAFRAIGNQVIYAKAFKRLTHEEIALCEQFIAENEGLDFHEFAKMANRAFVDKPKTKNFTSIIEFLNVANGINHRHLQNGAQ